MNLYSTNRVKPISMVFPKSWEETGGEALLAQAVHVYRDRAHGKKPTTKTRSVVTGSTRKIYRQKGTGLARHGDRQAPIFVGGGVAHGPRGVKRVLSLPKKMRKKATRLALSHKVKSGEVFVVDGLSRIKKTKDADSLVTKILKGQNLKKGQKMTLVLSKDSLDTARLFRNIPALRVLAFKQANAHSIFLGGKLLLDKKIFDTKNTKK